MNIYPPLPEKPIVTKEWITRIINIKGWKKKKKWENEKVGKVEMCQLDVNRGYVGMIRIVNVYFESGKKMNLLMKMSVDGVIGRRNIIMKDDVKEVLFYQSEYLGGCKCVKKIIPEIYYSYYSRMFGEYVIIMEKVEGCMVNLLTGNQIWGVNNNDNSIQSSGHIKPLEVVEKEYLECALFHSKFWNDKELLKLKWLKGVDWRSGKGKAKWILSIKRAENSWNGFKLKVKNGIKKVRINSRFLKIIDKTFEMTSWKKLVLHMKKSHFTFCHGDFHSANMIYSKIKDKVIMFDWSEAAVWEPSGDLAQTIISDISADKWGKKGENIYKLLKVYYEKLDIQKEYKWKTFIDDFARSGAEKWIWVFCIMSIYDGVPDNLSQYFHDQIWNFIQTFDTKNRDYYELKSIVCIY